MRLRELDQFDVRIASVLSRDGRISWRDLADQIGLSFSPTLRRVRRLEESGVIMGYVAVLDETHFLGSVNVFISVSMERQVKGMLDVFEQKVSSLPEVVGGYLVSGDSDYLIHALVRDLEHYQNLLGKLTAMPGVARIQSNFAVKTFFRRTRSFVPDASR